MLIISNNQPYTVTSYTDNFVVADNGHYSTTFKKDEIDVVVVGSNEEVPNLLIEKSVFDIKGDINGDRKYNRES